MLETLQKVRIIPVLEIEHLEQAVPLAEALREGGLSVLEITLRTPAALEAIRQVATQVTGISVGAGTVLSPEQAQHAIEAGAQFLVSPGLSADIVRLAQRSRVSIFPGVVTPTEIMQGLALGLNVFKFFPAEAMGGAAALKALSGPFAGVQFIPTGGLNADSIPAYLSLGCVLALGGSWMVPKALLAAGQFTELAHLAAQAAERAQQTRTHI